MRDISRLVACALATMPAACGTEPSFEERYENAEQTIAEKTAEIDAELADSPIGGPENTSAD